MSKFTSWSDRKKRRFKLRRRGTGIDLKPPNWMSQSAKHARP